ncbi:tetratricopeptide repeat protein [Aquimarina sp. W85]|uniref:tetratricopeptide repeat protein n=1 Tax=Aquimarina rhodophyticola TaxID=3342246 RepID=UPI00366B4EA3
MKIKKAMKKSLVIFLCLYSSIMCFSQEADLKQLVSEAQEHLAIGNQSLIRDGNFPKAEGEYRKAIAKNPNGVDAKYNLGNAYYNSEKYDEAIMRYSETAKTSTSKLEKHKAFHNLGNTYMEQKKYQEAVEAYKNALRNNAKDDETRYNLALAKKMLEEEQQQNQDQDQDKDDQNQDQKDQDQENKKDQGDQGDQDQKDKNKKDQGDQGDEKDQEKKGDEEDKKGEKGDEDEKKDPKDQDANTGDKKEEQQEGAPKPMQGQLSPQQVKSLLEAMNNQEKKVQDKINAKKVKGNVKQTDKDW